MLMLSKKIVVVVFSVLSISISALPNIENVKSDNEIITPGITGNIETKKIVSFWNETFDNGFPNFGGQLHTVYVRKNQILSSDTNKFEYEVFNLKCWGEQSKKYQTISKILEANNSSLNYASNQFVWGYLLID